MNVLSILLLLAVEIAPRMGAPEPRQPQLAAAHGQVALVYGAGTAIYFASSADGGRTFASAVQVADPGVLALGRHRGPRLAIVPGAIVITANAGKEHELMAWRSADRGTTWTSAGRINDVAGSAREGLHAMAADAKGNLFVTWLDLREKGTRLYGSRSTDGGRTWSKNFPVYASPDGTICQCCHPSAIADERGGIWVMWRNVIGSSRDLYLAYAADGEHFGPARKSGEGTWKLDACPMDGGSVAIERGQPVEAWRRGGEIFLASAGKPETRLGEGKDVAMAVGAKGAYALWSKDKALLMRAPGGTAPVKLADEGAFPDLVRLADGAVLAAWEEKNAIRVERLK